MRKKLCNEYEHVDGQPAILATTYSKQQTIFGGVDYIEACPGCLRLGYVPHDPWGPNAAVGAAVVKSRWPELNFISSYGTILWPSYKQPDNVVPITSERYSHNSSYAGWRCSSGIFIARRRKDRVVPKMKPVKIPGRRKRGWREKVAAG